MKRFTMFINLYLHSDKEYVYETGIKSGLSEEACKRFMYTGYEEEMTYEVEATTL
jgi:hypothetical protein